MLREMEAHASIAPRRARLDLYWACVRRCGGRSRYFRQIISEFGEAGSLSINSGVRSSPSCVSRRRSWIDLGFSRTRISLAVVIADPDFGKLRFGFWRRRSWVDLGFGRAAIGGRGRKRGAEQGGSPALCVRTRVYAR
jgi:hypothetical protein